MGELILKGPLKLMGKLNLKDKVIIDTPQGKKEALVELAPAGKHGDAPAPVPQPPPPASPLPVGTKVVILSSFNKTVTAGGKAIVTMGLAMQGMPPTWPGMLSPSVNSDVLANGLAVAVVGDKAQIFPSGASAPLTESGQ